MRCPDAVCTQYRLPRGVTFSFQVCTYSIEPTVANCAFNLFTKHALRVSGADEAVHEGPEVAGIFLGFAFTGNGKRLTWTTPRPNGFGVGPAGETESVGPPSHPGEQVDLGEFGEGGGLEFLDGGGVNDAIGDDPRGD